MELGKTCYISGPMRDQHCFNFKRFFYWQVLMENSGYRVVNPAELDCLKMFAGWKFTEDQWRGILNKDLAIIRARVHFMFMLRGWEDSEGANEERNLALELGLPVYYEDKEKHGYIHK